MFKLSLQTAIGATLLAAATAAPAQTAATPNPTGVAVTPQAAVDAQQRAVPRNDTGTLVRTGPTAAERSRDTANPAADAAQSTVSSRSSSGVPAAGSGSPETSGAVTTRRAARVDRN